jgi:hypothetical protein
MYGAILAAWLLVVVTGGLVLTFGKEASATDCGVFVLPCVILVRPSWIARRLFGYPSRSGAGFATYLLTFVMLSAVGVVVALRVVHPARHAFWFASGYWLVVAYMAFVEMLDYRLFRKHRLEEKVSD